MLYAYIWRPSNGVVVTIASTPDEAFTKMKEQNLDKTNLLPPSPMHLERRNLDQAGVILIRAH